MKKYHGTRLFINKGALTSLSVTRSFDVDDEIEFTVADPDGVSFGATDRSVTTYLTRAEIKSLIKTLRRAVRRG